MYYTKVTRLRELAFKLSVLSAEMLSIFADDDREQRQNEEELKKAEEKKAKKQNTKKKFS